MAQKLSTSDVWIVVPAYNEGPYLQRVLTKIARQASHIVVVDDGSKDDTPKIASHSTAILLRHRLNLGKGAALKTGCEYAFKVGGAKAVILMDGDDQHDPQEIPLFLAALNRGFEVVFGVRAEKRNMPWIKLKLNRLSSFLTYLLFGQYVLDIPSGYKAFTATAYESLAWKATDYAVELEIVARTAKSHLLFTTVNIKTIYHDQGKGMTALDLMSVVRHLVKLKATL